MSTTAQEIVKPRRSRGRPKLEEIAVIESKLLAVALKEFLAHGYGATSMARIVKAAGISKTTLYSRFPSKERLFRAIMREQIDRLAATTAQRLGASKPELEVGLKAYANRMLELSLQGDLLEVNRLIYSEAQRFPELGAAAAERTEIGIRRISRFIRECALADGLPCKDPEAAASAFIHMIRGWYVNVMLTNVKVRAARREKWVDRAVSALLSSRTDW
jgi:AcrR family transcriptional regulator